MAWYGASREAPAARAKSHHREAVAAVAAIGAVLLVCAAVASSMQGGRVGLLAAPVEGLLPYAEVQQLAANHHIWVGGHDLNPVHMVHSYRENHPDGWDKPKIAHSEPAYTQASMKGEGTQALASTGAVRKSFLAREQQVVAKKLAKDMRQLWKAKTPQAKESDLRKVEVMKGRFEALQGAVHRGPVLKQLPSRNDGRVHVEDPRTGKVYTLYEYNPAPGGYEDAELEFDPTLANDLKGIAPFENGIERIPTYQGEHYEYAEGIPIGTKGGAQVLYAANPAPGGYEDAELEFDPTLANDLKGIAPFENGIERIPTYQGEHYEYAEGIPIGTKAKKVQALYAPNDAPGGYEDAELEFDPTLANDLKGIAPFENGIERIPTYQGEHYEYAEGIPIGTSNKARKVQSLGELDPAWAASPWLLNDQPGGKAFGSAGERNPLYQGVAPEYPDFVIADDAGELHLVPAASVPGTVAHQRAQAAAEWARKKPQVVARRRAQLAARAARAAKAAPAAAHEDKKARTVAKAAMMQQLASLPGKDSRVWGSIYQPSKADVEGAKQDPNPLSGEGKAMYKHWQNLATRYNAVYDPSEDDSLAHNFGGGSHGSSWWANTNKGDDKWWDHDHTGRGY